MRPQLAWFLVLLFGCVESGAPPGAVALTAGPGGVTVVAPSVGGVPIAGELAVSWAADPAANGYYVFQSAGGTPYVLVAHLVDTGDGAPTSFLATQLTAGSYCYTVETTYPDGSTSDPGEPGCGVGVGNGDTAATRTKVIAPNPTGIPPYAAIDVANNVGNSTSNLEQYFAPGDHLHAVRLYVQDNTQPGPAVGYSGPTLLISRLKEYTAGDTVPATLGTSTVSDGSGTVQVISMTGLDVAIGTGGTSHSIQTIDDIGVARTVVWSIEIDYDHP